MNLHFIGLPHTETTRDYEWCAYTTKLRHIGEICNMIGYRTFLYSGERDEGKFTENVPVVFEEDRNKWFGHIDWNTEVFNGWNSLDPWWVEMNRRAIKEIQQRIQPGDAICIIAGRCQEEIVRAFPTTHILEWAVGYEGVLPNTYKCFESEIWRHHVYGKIDVNDGRFFDVVIPNSFDPADFKVKEDKEDYILYLGRLTPRKGLDIVKEVAKHHKVLTAGQGDIRIEGTEHVGVVGGEVKANLIANAKALVCPTTYIEPFGGVAVEAQLSGTPVICTDFGAFVETVVHGVTGYRCRTLREFLNAAENVKTLEVQTIASRARNTYSLEAVAPQWKRWFDQVQTLNGEGWYA